MCTYKGNVGHLMQHWTLCEILNVAGRHATGLNYIDAHAMAPWATHRETADAEFDAVRGVLAVVHNGRHGNGSFYEQAWHGLAEDRPGQDGYPSSAAFVKECWERDFSLLLCERDPKTARRIDEWLLDIRGLPNCNRAVLCPGDWRDRFVEGLPSPDDIGLPPGSLTLISFDPNLYSRRRSPKTRNAEALYRTDLGLTLHALATVKGPTVIQLSTYTVAGDNPQPTVTRSVSAILDMGGFGLVAKVIANRRMMSLVYARNVGWEAELAGLLGQFEEWHQLNPGQE